MCYEKVENIKKWPISFDIILITHQNLSFEHRELSMRTVDVQLEQSKNNDLTTKITRFEKEMEIVRSMLKQSEKEEERLRMELIIAYNELRYVRI